MATFLRCRWRWVLGAALVGLMLACWAVWWPAPGVPGVTRANYTRIKKGMTLAEVEAVFGGPGEEMTDFGKDGVTRCVWWSGEKVAAGIDFSIDGGKVVETFLFDPNPPWPEQVKDYLADLLGL